MKLQHYFAALALLPAVIMAQSPAAHAQEASISYQGRVLSGGQNFSGGGQFKFALVTMTNLAATATATPTITSGFLTSIAVTFGGRGYVTPPRVTISGGGGSGAVATAVLNNGSVIGITVNNPGIGYTGNPTVIVESPPENLTYSTYWSNDLTSQAGSEPVNAVSLQVQNGLFTVLLGDVSLPNMAALAPAVFEQPGLHLRVWFSDGLGGFTALHPPHPLAAAPYALVAEQVRGVLSPANLTGAYSNALTFNNPGNSFSGMGAGLTGLNAAQLASGLVPDERLSTGIARTGQVWLLSGNAGTSPSTHYLGTSDQQPLELRVNGSRVVWLENAGDSDDPDSLADGAPNILAGSSGNFIAPGLVGATIAGGGATNYAGVAATNAIQSNFGVIGGGLGNRIGTGAAASVVAGGWNNTISNLVTGTIAGGTNNALWAGADYSVIGGGIDNYVGQNAHRSVLAGGARNTARDGSRWSTIGGGTLNNIWNDSLAGTIAGGFANEIGTNTVSSVIGGGENNGILDNSRFGTVSGGNYNYIFTSGYGAVIGGGVYNRIAENSFYGTVPGGYNNLATNYSFAAGNTARAIHDASFVWNDGSANTSSVTNNSVTFRASKGYRFFTGSGSAGAQLAAGTTAWTTLSDRSQKKNFQPVDAREILEKLCQMPITRWHYLWEEESDTMNLGPVAQDFKAAFYPGRDDTGITTLEVDGVALAAIQGLNEKVATSEAALRDELKQKDHEIAELKQRLEKLEQMMQAR